MTGTDLCVNKPPTTNLFLKRASGCFQKVEKNCVDSGGEYVED
jgi:hypothetical protein